MVTLQDVLGLMGDDEFTGLVDLVQLGDKAVPHLSQILNDTSQDVFLRQQAAVALGKIGAAAGARAVRATLKDENPMLRLTAARALTLIKGVEVANSLQKLLKDHDPSVQKVAIQTLADVGREDTLLVLKEMQKQRLPSFLHTEINLALEKLRQRDVR